MVGFIGPFVCGACVVHLRTLRPEFVRDAFVRYRITYVSLVPMVLKNLERGLRAKFDELPPKKRWMLDRLIGLNKVPDAWPAASCAKPAFAATSAQGFWRGVAGADRRRRFHRSRDHAVLLRPWNPGDVRIRADGSVYSGDAQRSETISRGYGGEAAARKRSAHSESRRGGDRRGRGAKPRGDVALSR